MNLKRENELGTISINNIVFAKVIRDALSRLECKGRVWPASKKGHQIGNDNKFNINDLVNSIEVSFDEEGKVYLEFNIIIKFGTSIMKITDILADHIAETIEEIQKEKPAEIKIRILGVKSKQIAKRRREVIKRYES